MPLTAQRTTAAAGPFADREVEASTGPVTVDLVRLGGQVVECLESA
jgi:hypothetical protein